MSGALPFAPYSFPPTAKGVNFQLGRLTPRHACNVIIFVPGIPKGTGKEQEKYSGL